ncbi:MAG: hypothetical protein CM1200mP2_25940 [Planctomycetaceae bacterium]|nr:MAG: hypothetical protein CM1200mP2_25940 [Planctomycetaceae bacterium]
MFAMQPPPELSSAPPEFTSVEADAAAELIRLALAEDLGMTEIGPVKLSSTRRPGDGSRFAIGPTASSADCRWWPVV